MSDQVSDNFRAFEKLLPDLMRKAAGQFVLLHNGKPTGIFPSSLNAVHAGLEKFGEGDFSVQEITDKIEDLGFYSHVGGALHA